MPDAAFFTRARAAAEMLMQDTCTISRDPAFLTDSVLNETTGQLTAPAAGPLVQVYAGPCLVTPVVRQDTDVDEGGGPIVRGAYEATVPLSSARVAIGDVLTVTVAVRDPQLVGARFVVRRTTVATNAFQRRMRLDLSVRADAQ